ncbi:lanthionine synthetase C family protein [Kribbella sandramycini]|uniref:Lanthionine synthetase C family protein n=1 Tax=Kribbella sandramycini TaxID=60450 RepID=A0A7Y4KZ08_9ACTN|nr:lanthionine synthetase C family protein [Kribbella sandramycini]MBB6569623.1 hypothetical protein [Kribbella sandramycini]NOL40542.1 lanthionine synthetase C family protein [Kribbella sandramycini]
MTTTAQQLASGASRHSLGRGLAGQALLAVEQARTDQGSWARAHEQIMRMTNTPVAAHLMNSLFEGAPAVAYVLTAADQPTYRPALRTLDCHIDGLTRERLRRAHQRIDGRQLPALREFDLISGLTGLGVYQLRRHHGGELLDAILRYLVRLCEPVRDLPGWWTANDTADHPSTSWPGGHGNLGIAHGISGPLALLSIAAQHGHLIPGQTDAIQTICSWLDHWQQDTWWPGTITKHEHDSDQLQQAGPQRPSWCYGTPGIARAQQLAGLALADRTRQHRAETALLNCVTDDIQHAQLGDTTLCHGWSGLLQATIRAADDAAPGGPLTRQLPDLRRRQEILVESRTSQHRPELLEGSTGIQLVQLSAMSTTNAMQAWDACLLLSS